MSATLDNPTRKIVSDTVSQTFSEEWVSVTRDEAFQETELQKAVLELDFKKIMHLRFGNECKF